MQFRIVILASLLLELLSSAAEVTAGRVAVRRDGDSSVTLSNEFVTLQIDAQKHAITLSESRSGDLLFADGWMTADGWGIRNVRKAAQSDRWPGWKVGLAVEKFADAGGEGARAVVSLSHPSRPAVPAYLFAYSLSPDSGTVTLGFGARNTGPHGVRLMSVSPLSWAKVLPGRKLEHERTLNGAAGSEATRVLEGANRESANSLLLTAREADRRRSIVWGGLANQEFGKWVALRDNTLELSAKDPVGRLVDPGQTYWSKDTFYLDAVTDDPFAALEKYGRAMRAANDARPNVYDFPVLCGWGVGSLSHLPGVNDSAKLVGELQAAEKAGVTKYTRVAIRLEPDTYCYKDGNTEQGWWDDAHWAKYGHLVPPYETMAKWCEAIRAHNGIPYTYFQVGMPSDDYATAFPEQMLFKDVSRIAVRHNHHQPLVTFDYTSQAFQKHMREVWSRLRRDGIRGIKFDYPETGWRPEAGGFEDRHATTASAYREVFRLCREGLGADAFIDERNLGESGRPCLDVTAGLVDTQRNWSDSNEFEAGKVTIGGLRWYKNRTVFNYYPDEVTVHGCTPEVRRAMLTMVYLTSGRIDLATSFTLFTPEIVRDFTRIYPAYREPITARPLDAFTGVADPQVYDLELTPDWHQIALLNTSGKAAEISVPLAGDRVEQGAVGLRETEQYYAYDFWNDRLLGVYSGRDRITSRLEPLHCQMISVRKVESYPQVLSTSRHVLQGWVDLTGVRWDAGTKTLSGVAKVVGGEAFRIALANNGHAPRGVTGGEGVRLEKHAAGDRYSTLVIESDVNADRAWSLKFD
jgi:hypothetical protein